MKWRRFLQRFRKQGLLSTLHKAWSDHVFRKMQFFVISWEFEDLEADAPMTGGARFKRIETIADIPELGGWLAHRRSDFETMLERGSVGYVALRDGKAVGCAWYAPTDVFEPSIGMTIRVLPGEAYVYGLLIDRAERRVGLGAKLAHMVMQDMARSGIRRAFTYIERHNVKSFRIMMWLGMDEPQTMLETFRLFGFTIYSRVVPATISRPEGYRTPRRFAA